MPLSAYAKDNFIAPDMSRFNSAQIKDMSGTSVEQEHWLSNYVLNSLFRVDLDEPLRQTLFNFVRRTQFAFREYALAREQTMAYLRGVDAVSSRRPWWSSTVRPRWRCAMVPPPAWT